MIISPYTKNEIEEGEDSIPLGQESERNENKERMRTELWDRRLSSARATSLLGAGALGVHTTCVRSVLCSRPGLDRLSWSTNRVAQVRACSCP